MNKILRYSLVCLLAVICGSTYAQTLWEEDWSDYAEYIKADLSPLESDGYTFTGSVFNDDGSYKSGTALYKEKIAGGEAPELLIAKNGGTFTAEIDLGGASGELTLSFKSNKKIEVSAEGAEVGDLQATGNDYSCTITPSAGSISLTFTNNLSQNCRTDNFKLIVGQSTTKPAGLSWGTSSRTVTIGEENTFPTLQNDNNLPVTYSSSDKSVATINSNGEITLVAAGKTTITAKFAGNSEFDAGEASYELTVKEQEVVTPAQEVSVSEALSIIDALEEGATTKETYQVKGFVVGTPDFQRRDDGSLYGNVNFDMADTAGGSPTITAFRCKNFEGKSYEEETINNFKEGDEIVVEGKLQKYKDKDGNITPEIASGGIIISINGQDEAGVNSITINKNSNAPVYNMAGQRVSKAVKGVYIQDGKKFVVK